MNKYIAFLIACIASSAFAQTVQIDAAAESLELISVKNMPLGLPVGELDAMQRSIATKAPDGISTIERSPEKITGFFTHLNTAKASLANPPETGAGLQKDVGHAPQAHRDLSALSLRFKIADFDPGSLIAAIPVGTKIDGSWTGLDRFFRFEKDGVVRLTEYDLAATGGKFFMAKEAVNANVNGKPAISKVFTGANGESIEEVVWVKGHKFYMLTFSPDPAAATQLKGSFQISALSLASRVR